MPVQSSVILNEFRQPDGSRHIYEEHRMDDGTVEPHFYSAPDTAFDTDAALIRWAEFLNLEEAADKLKEERGG